MKKKIRWVLLALVVALLAGGVYVYAFFTKPFSETGVSQGGGSSVISTNEPVATKPVQGNKANVLLIGSDQRSDEPSRADTLLLISMDMDKNTSTMISIPRDSYVNIPGRGMDKITHAHAFGGIDLTIKTVENFLNVPINYYVRTNFEGFKAVVDALGGVTIKVDKPMVYERIGANFSPGVYKMNGEQALAYVRYRSDSGDYARMSRQQMFLKELLAESKKPSAWIKMPQVIPALRQAVTTNLSPADMLRFGKFVQDYGINTMTLNGEGTNIGGVYYLKPNEKSLAEIKNKLADKK